MDTIGTLAWWGLIVGVAWAASGVLEYVKGFFKRADGVSAMPSWFWRLILAVVAAGAGVAIGQGKGLSAIILNAGAVLAAAQIGYPVLVQLPEAFIANMKKRLGE